MFVCFEGLGEEAVDSPVSDFPFIPLDCDGQKDMARRLGKRTPTSNRYACSKPLDNLPNRKPLSCDNPEPDGNCCLGLYLLPFMAKKIFFTITQRCLYVHSEKCFTISLSLVTALFTKIWRLCVKIERGWAIVR